MAPGTGSVVDHFSAACGWGWFRDGSKEHSSHPSCAATAESGLLQVWGPTVLTRGHALSLSPAILTGGCAQWRGTEAPSLPALASCMRPGSERAMTWYQSVTRESGTPALTGSIYSFCWAKNLCRGKHEVSSVLSSSAFLAAFHTLWVEAFFC